MNKETIDIKGYFERIGYTGDVEITPETLKELHLKHVESIPFENLDPLLGRPVKLDLPALEEKIIHRQRGGYCFEQNTLFYHALQEIGFKVTRLGGRVLWKKDEDEITARTHMLLLIFFEDKIYLADVGFGGNSLTAPLEFVPDKEQQTPHEDYKIVEKKGHYLLQSRIQGKWRTLYRFILDPQYQVDYKVANWYTATHPDSPFTDQLMVARAGENCRYVLAGNKFSVHRLNGESEEKILRTPEEILSLLEEVFHLQLPDREKLDTVLQKITTSKKQA